MSSRRPSPSPQKRITALKRADGEPLTRFDIQYDVLHHIFHDVQSVFTDPYSGDSAPKVTFRDLYIKTILHSSKATKALKDKMVESETFAEDFAMLALLVNVGRVNTTMSFFPEMKTAIRTYHPIPSLQRTTGNLQDAPRIKHILKSATLKDDHAPTPSTPADILFRVKSEQVPSTTVMNLIFVLANHSTPIGRVHFSEKLDFTDLFIRETLSSLSRARAFLWLCYHYLECSVENNDDDYDDDGPTNPFADGRRGSIPTIVQLSDTEMNQENVDSEEEKILAEKLVIQRLEILKTQSAKEISKHNKMSGLGAIGVGVGDKDFASTREGVKSKIKRADGKQAINSQEQKKTPSAVRSSKVREENGRELSPPTPDTDEECNLIDPCRTKNQLPQKKYPPHLQFGPHTQPRHVSIENFESRETAQGHHRPRYSPYPSSPSSFQIVPAQDRHTRYGQRLSTPPRSMLEQAWHIVTTTDPLLDSDEEGADEHLRYDYIQRLKVINALRHKEPTPEVELYGPNR